MIGFTADLTRASVEVMEQVQHCLVVLRNGGFGYGAGIIWQPDGLIVTNNHVIGKVRNLAVTADGSEYPLKILARDWGIDLALLQIEARDLPTAQVGDSRRLRVGEIVLAVGHPWGQHSAVTVGCISALGKAHPGGKRKKERKPVDIIRSDVHLAPGNSGGPLLNARGQVVGINTMVVGGDQGIALPSHVVGEFLKHHLGDGSG